MLKYHTENAHTGSGRCRRTSGKILMKNKSYSKLFIGGLMPCYAHHTILAKILGVVKRNPYKFL